jgi:hypothetical protein
VVAVVDDAAAAAHFADSMNRPNALLLPLLALPVDKPAAPRSLSYRQIIFD